MFILDQEKLLRLSAGLHETYAAAEPFPHVVIDNFLPEEVVRNIARSFPTPNEVEWHESSNSQQKKLAVERESIIETGARWLLYQLNSATFMEFLERLTAIDGLIPDPYFTGGGLHQIERGGYLKIHADFNRHIKFGLDRRLNLLLYLNEHWKDEYGGYLELWDREVTHCVRRISPIFNRCVIFSTTDFSFHGHPEPLTCPEGITRKSLALYYYSNGRPESERSQSHGTLTRPRPGETIPGIGEPRFQAAKVFLKRLVPPIVIDLRTQLKRK